MFLTGIFLLAIGWVLHHWVERQKFYRRDPLGNQVHKSYMRMLVLRFIESVAGLVGGAASLFGFLILLFRGFTYLGFFR